MSRKKVHSRHWTGTHDCCECCFPMMQVLYTFFFRQTHCTVKLLRNRIIISPYLVLVPTPNPRSILIMGLILTIRVTQISKLAYPNLPICITKNNASSKKRSNLKVRDKNRQALIELLLSASRFITMILQTLQTYTRYISSINLALC